MSTDTETLMYWIRSYNATLNSSEEHEDKTYCFHRAREWAAHIIAKGQQ